MAANSGHGLVVVQVDYALDQAIQLPYPRYGPQEEGCRYADDGDV